MAITTADLKFFQSERMTDNDDGGGRMTGASIVSGADNQIFDDLSDVDRAAGDVSIRKAFAAVTSADTDKYLDAGVALFREPTDENVSVLLFSTGDYYDEREALKTRLEQTISRGGRWNGWLWGQHLIGQRAVVIWQRPEASLIATGARLELVAKTNNVEQYSQFLWITRVVDNLRMIYEAYNDQTLQYVVRELICELAEPLQYNFAGLEPARGDPAVVTGTLLYDTRYNAEAVPLFGIQPTVEDASISDFSIKIADLYTPLIPTALSETALPDVTPGGDSPALVEANASTVSFTTTTESIKSGVSLYCGTGILPGTLHISVSGAIITDANGAALLSDTEIGSVNYGSGVITWNSNCPNYSTASKTVTFTPAARPLRVADTAAQVVTTSNRGYVWVLTLSPIPAPATLRVAYQVNNVWYVLTEQGTGLIQGVDSSYGSGSLNFSTGTVMITTGALPDVNSMLIYSWGTAVNYTARGGDPVDAPVVRGQTEHAGVAPGTVSVEWTVGVTTYTLDDTPAADGNLTGTGGTGFIRYATGAWWVRPTTLPPVNTEFVIDYDYGAPTEETFAHPIREQDGTLLLTLAAIPRAHSMEVEWNLLVEDYEVVYSVEAEYIPPASEQYDPIKIVRDDGAGGLTISGGTNGTVTYNSRTVQFLPDVTVSIPKPLYSKHLVGTETETYEDGATNVINTYRTLFDGYEYIPAGAQYPSDASGYVKVRYREVGGDSNASEPLTFSQLELDLTKAYGETLVSGGTRFTLGGSVYVDIGGQLYRDPSPLTGAGSLCGTLDRSTGRARITAWTAGGANSVTLQALTTVLDGQPVEEVIFRTPINPLRAGTLQLRYQLLTGATKTKTVDDSGLLADSDCTLRVDYPLGIVRARFGLWKVDSELSPSEKLESWYDPNARVTIGGVLKIWKPIPALADSIIYNAVAQTFLPPDSTLLGLNAARLPVDGRALVFNTGRLALVHHTDSLTEQSLSPTQVINCNRTRLYRAVIEDALGARLGAEQYSVDRAAGTITLSPTLNLTGFTAPYTLLHTIADLVRLVAVDINGTLTFNKPLSHAYPKEASRVSSLLYIGTLQARVSQLFAQSTWTSVWQDTVIGTPPLCQYNDAQYPLVVTNEGAYPDRFLVQFTSATSFRVIGENLGIIGIGDTTQDCSPINALTSQPYFSIDYRGWGSGWATGNCLRFNLIGACYPVDLIRATQPSEPTGTDDSIELLLLGNVDA